MSFIINKGLGLEAIQDERRVVERIEIALQLGQPNRATVLFADLDVAAEAG